MKLKCLSEFTVFHMPGNTAANRLKKYKISKFLHKIYKMSHLRPVFIAVEFSESNTF